jgi:Flp pilus assembly pilin Flp
MLARFAVLISEESGQDLVEVALLISLVAMLSISGLYLMGFEITWVMAKLAIPFR